jgi:VCBS repeat-containing protein
LAAVTPIATIDVRSYALADGEYRVKTTLSGLVASLSVTADLDRTLLNQFVITDQTDATGNILENDILGSFNSTLAVKADHVGAYTNVGTDQIIAGDFGSITIKSDGSYSYAIRPNISYSAVDRVDAFDYRVTHPSGNTEVGRLTIEVSPSGVGVASANFRTFNVSELLDNYLGTELRPTIIVQPQKQR